MIAEYLNADRETAIALKDEWGIADILRAVDRRIGRRQWDGLLENINPKVSNAVGKIISSRKSELLGVAYTQIRNPDSNLSLLGRS